MADAQDVTKEIAAYDKIRADLEAKHMSKWVLVKDGELVGVYDSFEAVAEDAGAAVWSRPVPDPSGRLTASDAACVRHVRSRECPRLNAAF
jgi:hypothetical protein